MVVVTQERSLFQGGRSREACGLVSRRPSKVQKALPGLCKDRVGQRSVGVCSWAVKVRWVTVVGSVMGSCWLRAVLIA